MEDSIRVESIRIENVFGVKNLEFDPDGVSVIRGDNDTGKTSVLRAINLVLTGGQNMEALHKDSESGRVEFELSDGTRVWASLTENKIYYNVDGHPDLTARQFLDRIQDEISTNPIQILQARPRDRGQILLEALPMTVDPYSFEEAVSPLHNIGIEKPILHEDQHALEALGDKSSGVIGELYEKRQSLHGAKRDKEGAVNDLQEAVGDHDDPDPLKSEREKVNSDLEDLREAKDEAIQEVNDWEANQIEQIRKEAEERRSQRRDNFDGSISEKEVRRERLNEKIEQAERAQQTVETLQKRKEELEELSDRYDSLTEAIENLRSLRTDFQDDLPSGVALDEDGEIVNDDGIRFENWNEQSQVQFALRIAEMRMGDLPLIPLDGIEKVVGEQREQLIRFCKDSPAQFILTEAVAGEELSVEHA